MSSESDPGPEIAPSLPSADALAQIAAQFVIAGEKDLNQAVRRALRLWRVADAKINSVQYRIRNDEVEDDDYELTDEEVSARYPDVSFSNSFPPTWQEFLEKIVGADDTEGTPRVRRYLRDLLTRWYDEEEKAALENEVTETLQRYRKNGFATKLEWARTAYHYLAWWHRKDLHDKRSAAGKKGVAARRKKELEKKTLGPSV